MAGTETPFLYQQLADELERMIRSGALRPGDRVPSVRRVSERHHASIPTVVQAYMLLENRRLIEARPRSGFYVRPQLASALAEPAISRKKPTARKLAEFPPLMTLLSDISDARLIPLGSAIPGTTLLPAAKLARLAGTVARRYPEAALSYNPPPGCEALRREISRRSLDWGLSLEPEQFVVTNGATEAVDLALQAVTQPGDTVAVESPTYYGFLNLLAHSRLRALPIPASSQSGIDIDALAAAARRQRISAILLAPNFANPLGSLMPEANRSALLAIAAEHHIAVIEDDIHGDLPHDGVRPRCLKALDPEGLVMLCGSYSKTLAPGYRVGFISGGRHHERIVDLKSARNLGNAALPSLVIAEFLRNGGYERHLRIIRRTYQQQVMRVREAVAESFPKGTRIANPRGGFVLWIELPKRADCLKLFHEARRAGISIGPGVLFSPDRTHRNFIRLSCGFPWSPRIESAIGQLGQMVAAQLHP